MPCTTFRMFKDYSEEDIKEISGFLFKYGKCLSTELTGMDKREWLRYHEANMPSSILEGIAEVFKEPPEDLIKHITVNEDSVAGMEYFSMKRKSIELALRRDAAKFRLEKGI